MCCALLSLSSDCSAVRLHAAAAATGKPITSHSTSAVPFIAMVPADCELKFSRKEGGVADVAPTMMTYMGIDVPKEMTGKSCF